GARASPRAGGAGSSGGSIATTKPAETGLVRAADPPDPTGFSAAGEPAPEPGSAAGAGSSSIGGGAGDAARAPAPASAGGAACSADLPGSADGGSGRSGSADGLASDAAPREVEAAGFFAVAARRAAGRAVAACDDFLTGSLSSSMTSGIGGISSGLGPSNGS